MLRPCAAQESLPPPVTGFWVEMASKCLLTGEQCAKFLRACLEELRADKHLDKDVQTVATSFSHFFCACAAVTPRITTTVVEAGLRKSWEGAKPSEIKVCARQLVGAFVHCKGIEKSMSSGTKTPAPIVSVCLALRKWRGVPSPDKMNRSTSKDGMAENDTEQASSKVGMAENETVKASSRDLLAENETVKASSRDLLAENETEKAASRDLLAEYETEKAASGLAVADFIGSSSDEELQQAVRASRQCFEPSGVSSASSHQASGVSSASSHRVSGAVDILSLYGIQAGSAAGSSQDAMLEPPMTIQSDAAAASTSQAGLGENDCIEIRESSDEGDALHGGQASNSVSAHAAVKFVDMTSRELIMIEGSHRQAVPLEAGPAGFAVACVGTDIISTQVPNSSLAAFDERPVIKRPGSKVLKRPAASVANPESQSSDDQEQPDAEEEEQDAEQIKYVVLYYKQQHAVALRIAGGGRQVISMSGARYRQTVSKPELLAIASEVRDQLMTGVDIAAAKKHGLARIRQVSEEKA